jgi:hypothetical protein
LAAALVVLSASVAHADGKPGAFAGAKAKGEVKAGAGRLGGAAKLGFQDGKLKLGSGLGAALGVGAGGKAQVEVDVSQLGKLDAGGVVRAWGENVGKAVGAVVSGLRRAGGKAASALDRLGPALNRAFDAIGKRLGAPIRNLVATHVVTALQRATQARAQDARAIFGGIRKAIDSALEAVRRAVQSAKRGKETVVRVTTPGHKFVEEIQLRGPLTQSRKWIAGNVAQAKPGKRTRFDITIVEIAKDGPQAKTYNYGKCFLSRYVFPVLSADGTGNLYEEVSIKTETLCLQ